ncbi:DinB family protein [Aquitalea sp. LB_tupeE]|uniref:DinB family protein n=1 Tax=Aquitalea sp. LB_tupeE TaxID=2748078 RepID=UPI0015B7AC5B|nr:DinB family protein [Aquitalea sp. LB_tupeE]NWK79834.1 DinB family protein [Aquitalea sp. LB_tupeE]
MHAMLHTLFQAKAWANRQLFTLLEQQLQALSDETQTAAVRMLNHVWLVEQIFQANLQQQPHGFDALNTPDTPTLAQLQARQQASDDWYRAYLESLDNVALTQAVDFRFVDGKPGRMQRSEMLLHLITHGSYHRGMVGRMLAEAGIRPPKDSLTIFLHQTA